MYSMARSHLHGNLLILGIWRIPSFLTSSGTLWHPESKIKSTKSTRLNVVIWRCESQATVAIGRLSAEAVACGKVCQGTQCLGPDEVKVPELSGNLDPDHWAWRSRLVVHGTWFLPVHPVNIQRGVFCVRFFPLFSFFWYQDSTDIPNPHSFPRGVGARSLACQVIGVSECT